jgi:hypothetical protein
MHERPITTFRPGLEPLEEKRPLSASASTAPFVNLKAGSQAPASPPADTPGALGAVRDLPTNRAVPTRRSGSVPKENGSSQINAHISISSVMPKPNHGYLVYRITNPNRFNNQLIPPFNHVLVQALLPVPGQVYNVLYVVVRNGTARTFDASSGFMVRFPGQPVSIPILTGNEQWKPGQEFVFYVLTKKYYPLPVNGTPRDKPSLVTGGFNFLLGGARSVAIPGPSGIVLRIHYDPARFDRTLDAIVAFGQGAEGGAGVKYGLPDTAIYEFVSAKTRRSDFGGYF